jgi:hypothetical protein
MKVLVVSMGLAALGALGFGIGSIGAASASDVATADGKAVVSTEMVAPTSCTGCMESHVWTPSSGDTGWVSSCGCSVELRFDQWSESPGACFGTQPNCGSEPCHFRWDLQYQSTCTNAVVNGTVCGTPVAAVEVPSTSGWTSVYGFMPYANVPCGERCNIVYTIAQKSGSLVCVDKATLSARAACSLCQ